MMSEFSTAEQAGNRKAQGSEWTPDEFLAMVSHELRNPISAILGWADIVSAKYIDAETSAHAIAAIQHSALLAANLINHLMDFSRINNGTFKLDVQEIALVSTIEAAIEITKPQAKAKAIELEAELPECPTQIVGDAARLQQVFTNLISNAIKFTPPGGRVQVRVECRDQAEITVTDTGRGISAEFLPFVFDRFRQQVAETTEAGGLGLGLAIARHLVEEHGGRIYASSAGSGKGATFTVCLPLGKLDLQSARQSETKDPVSV
jgi:two-component system CheB/CheR fusion protein